MCIGDFSEPKLLSGFIHRSRQKSITFSTATAAFSAGCLLAAQIEACASSMQTHLIFKSGVACSCSANLLILLLYQMSCIVALYTCFLNAETQQLKVQYWLAVIYIFSFATLLHTPHYATCSFSAALGLGHYIHQEFK